MDDDPDEALVTIRAEGGHPDATDFAAMLLRMYLRWAERHGHDVDVREIVHSEVAGIVTATFHVRAPRAYRLLSVEHGAHRLVRISPFEDHGRRRTSLVDVSVREGEPVETGAPWGHQVRSYVLHPFRTVKDLRSGHEADDPDAVLDGDLDGFLEAGIRRQHDRGAPG